MSSNAYIKLVPSAAKETISTQELKELFYYYKDITSKTGVQTDWKFDEAAFPYEVKEEPLGTGNWFYLHSTNNRYKAIVIGVDEENIETEDGVTKTQTYIQVTLPEISTFGDKGKANEFCKFLAKKLQAELHLFNGRVMYFNPRK
jgi:hypothetical protein